jgi:hypothetical protein
LSTAQKSTMIMLTTLEDSLVENAFSNAASNAFSNAASNVGASSKGKNSHSNVPILNTIENSIIQKSIEETLTTGNICDWEKATGKRLTLQYAAQCNSTCLDPASNGDCLVIIVENDEGLSCAGLSCEDSSALERIQLRRSKIVDRVKENLQKEIEKKLLQKVSAIDKEPNLESKKSMSAELDRWLVTAESAILEKCLQMKKPGTVMGETELQAVADNRGAPVKVLGLCFLLKIANCFFLCANFIRLCAGCFNRLY